MAKTTLSVIKADVGGYVGHSSIHPRLMEEAEKRLTRAREKGPLIDFRVMRCGDDLELIMTHNLGTENHFMGLGRELIFWFTILARVGVISGLIARSLPPLSFSEKSCSTISSPLFI